MLNNAQDTIVQLNNLKSNVLFYNYNRKKIFCKIIL